MPAEVVKTIATDKPVEKPVDKPTDKPADKPVTTIATDKPVEKTADEIAAEKTASDLAKAEAKKAGEPPEKYELGIEEGANVNPTLVTEAEGIFREIGLTNDQGVKVAGLMSRANELAAETWRTTTDAWAQEVKADPDIGGDKFDATSALVQGVVSKFGSKAFNEALEQYGFGNHPELVRFIHNIAKAMGEDRTPSKPPGSAPTEEASLRQRYPTMFPKE